MRPGPKSSHAHHGKSDALDAEAAARTAMTLKLDHIPQPRATGTRTVLRTLLSTRKLLDHQRTANRNTLLALLRSVDLGIDARKALTQTLVRQLAATRPDAQDPPYLCRREVRRLARTILEQEELLKENSLDLRQLVEHLTPGLIDIPGSGPSRPRLSSAPTHITTGSGTKQRSRPWLALPRYPHPPAILNDTASVDPVTDSSTALLTPSCVPACPSTPKPVTTWHGQPPLARPAGRPIATSSAMSPAPSSASSAPCQP